MVLDRIGKMKLEERLLGALLLTIFVILTILFLAVTPFDPSVYLGIIFLLWIEMALLLVFAFYPSRREGAESQDEGEGSKEPVAVEKAASAEPEKTEPHLAEEEKARDPGGIICCGGLLYIGILYIIITAWSSIGSWYPLLVPTLIVVAAGVACILFIRRLQEEDEDQETGGSKESILASSPTGSGTDKRRSPSASVRPQFWQSLGTPHDDARSKTIAEGHPTYQSKDGTVTALRGGEIVGSRFRFKVKVVNSSDHIINDVTVFVLSYPRDALVLASKDDDCQFTKIEPGGFRSPHFDFRPTQDCVRGDIVAGVSYVDPWGKAHTLATRPFTIRAVCDLLMPKPISKGEFRRKLEELEAGEIQVKVEDWTPEEMYEKSLKVLGDSNFHEVETSHDIVDGVFIGSIAGWASGKYTGKNLGVEVSVSGPAGVRGASCRIRVSGEDDAMILPAIDDLQERLSAWLCPMCFSKLSVQEVENLKDGKPVKCPFCGVTIGR